MTLKGPMITAKNYKTEGETLNEVIIGKVTPVTHPP